MFLGILIESVVFLGSFVESVVLLGIFRVSGILKRLYRASGVLNTIFRLFLEAALRAFLGEAPRERRGPRGTRAGAHGARRRPGRDRWRSPFCNL